MKNIVLLLMLFASSLMLFGQEVVTTSGGEGSGSGGSVSYTVGQVTNKLLNNENHSVVEGVQQPYEISTETGVELADISVSMKTFPNPAKDILTLQINDFNIANLQYKLYRMDGKLIKSGQVKGIETNINMSKVTAAVYFLSVNKDGKTIKTFKIVKN